MRCAGALALVTCHDALQSRLTAHFQTLLAAQPGAANASGQLISELAGILVRANQAAACTYIEEVAMEKSQLGIEDALAPVRSGASCAQPVLSTTTAADLSNVGVLRRVVRAADLSERNAPEMPRTSAFGCPVRAAGQQACVCSMRAMPPDFALVAPMPCRRARVVPFASLSSPIVHAKITRCGMRPTWPPPQAVLAILLLSNTP